MKIYCTFLKVNCNTVLEPQLPEPEVCKEEFNDYKKTMLQEHVYEFIFKEGKVANNAETEQMEFLINSEEINLSPPDLSGFESLVETFIKEAI